MELAIKILHSQVLAKVEGLSAVASQHNPQIPFEILWASAGDTSKLDLYYKEAVNDLEDKLKDYVTDTHELWDVLRIADDLDMTLRVSDKWNTKLLGLLKNRMQDFLAHSVFASWYMDIPGDVELLDFTAMAAEDLASILKILEERDLTPASMVDRKGDDGKVCVRRDYINFGDYDKGNKNKDIPRRFDGRHS